MAGKAAEVPSPGVVGLGASLPKCLVSHPLADSKSESVPEERRDPLGRATDEA
jgi:hypothetical protein